MNANTKSSSSPSAREENAPVLSFCPPRVPKARRAVRASPESSSRRKSGSQAKARTAGQEPHVIPAMTEMVTTTCR